MKKSALRIAIAAAAFASAGAMAATDGALGPTSTGTVLVQVSKGSVVQITGLADLALGNWTDVTLAATGALGVTATDTACVYSSVGNYHVSLSSANGGAFSGAVPASLGALATAAVAPGGTAFPSPGDTVVQPTQDIGAVAGGVPGDGICSLAQGDVGCVVDLDGAPASAFVGPNAAVAQVNATYIMAGPGGNVAYDASFKGTASDGSSMGPYVGSNNVTCNGIDNADVAAHINNTALVGLPDGSYSDTLTILVSPN